MWVPALCALVVASVIFFTIKDSPEEAGFEPIEATKAPSKPGPPVVRFCPGSAIFRSAVFGISAASLVGVSLTRIIVTIKVYLELILHGFNGIEVLQRLRTPSIKPIVLSVVLTLVIRVNLQRPLNQTRGHFLLIVSQ